MHKTIPVVEEQAEVGKRVVETGRVHISKRVTERVEEVELPSISEHVDVRRVAVNRPVDAPVATRQEGDTLIVPVHEEVITRQLVLVEEIHITRRETGSHSTQQVALRREEVSVERSAPAGAGADRPTPRPSPD